MIIIFKEKSNEFLKQTEGFYKVILNRKFSSKNCFFSNSPPWKSISEMEENNLCFKSDLSKENA